MNIKQLCTILVATIAPWLSMAQYGSAEELVEAYSQQSTISYTHVGKGMVWMAKAGAPKGAMDGVENIYILKFDEGVTSPLYAQFRSSADSLFAATGAECILKEPTKKGETEVYMERKESPTEYMTYMFTPKGEVTFMRMSGQLPSSLQQ